MFTMNIPDIVIDGKRLSCIGHGNVGAVFVDNKKKYVYKISRLERKEFDNEVEFAQDNNKKSHLLKLADSQVMNTAKEGINFVFPEPHDIQWWPEAKREKWRKRMSGKYIGVLKYPFLNDPTLMETWRNEWRSGQKRSIVRPMYDVLVALQNIHGRGYEHRDIHPGNIIIESGSAILIDYGRVWKFGSDMRYAVQDLMRLLICFHPIMDFNIYGVQFEWAPYEEFMNKLIDLPILEPYKKLESYGRASDHYKKELLCQYLWVLDPLQAARLARVDVGLKKHGLDPVKHIVHNSDLSVLDYLWMLDHWDDVSALKRRLVQLKKQL
jgi:serine/threonine protein kinase